MSAMHCRLAPINLFIILLLEGEQWLSVESIQYVDVRDKKLPSADFWEQLTRVVTRQNLAKQTYALHPKTGLLYFYFGILTLIAIITSIAISFREAVTIVQTTTTTASHPTTFISFFSGLVSIKSLGWGIIYLTIIPSWFIRTRKLSGLRGTYSIFLLLVTTQPFREIKAGM
jgi:hypothetical protein